MGVKKGSLKQGTACLSQGPKDMCSLDVEGRRCTKA